MPKRSLGCYRCRERKIRCDGRKPKCDNCTRRRVSCPGYERMIGAHFVVHTSITALHAYPRLDSRNLPHVIAQAVLGSVDVNVHVRNDNVGLPQSQNTAGQGHLEHASPSNQQSFLGQLKSPASLRDQLLANFLGVYFAVDRIKGIASDSYLLALPNVMTSLPLLEASVDALCLASLGSTHKSIDKIQAARLRYGHALTLLSQEVTRPASKHIERQRSIIVSCLLIGLYERFDAVTPAKEGARKWRAHTRGVQSILRAFGPSMISTPFDWQILSIVQTSSFFLGFCHREATVFADPAWTDFLVQHEREDTTGQSLFWMLMSHMTTVLARTDALIDRYSGTAQDRNDLKSLCKDIGSLTRKIDSCARKITKAREQDDAAMGKPMSWYLTSKSSLNSKLHHMYQFESVEAVIGLTMCWTPCLVLDCTLLRLAHFLGKGKVDNSIAPRNSELVQQKAHHRAVSLCYAAEYSCAQFDSYIVKEALQWHVTLAQNFFLECGCSSDEVAWCQEILQCLVEEPVASGDADDIGMWNLGKFANDASHGTRFKSVDIKLPE